MRATDGMRRRTAGDSSAQLFLPWATGQSWRLLGGPHNFHSTGTPWSSLDFAGGDGLVRAARGGVVRRDCANFVRIDHGDGWHTSYYHLTNIRVRSGQTVPRGQVLGTISTATGCGGTADVAHVHFTLWRFTGRFDFSNRQQYPISGVSIGGWTVEQGSAAYSGCLVRDFDGTRICRYGYVDTTLRPVRVWTRNGNGIDETNFQCGDPIQYAATILNSASTTVTATLTFDVARVGSRIYSQSFPAPVPPGTPGYYAASAIPADAYGTYSLVVQASYNNAYTMAATQFSVLC
jgi:murein DD-endopeptidase MepM/ murein hydrolase activator NlpD